MLQVRFQPPAISPITVMELAKEVAEDAGANLLLEASQPLVPRDTGKLADSGHVTHDGLGAAVVYDAVADDGYPYGIRQHEDTSLNHPHGGQAKFLEQPMHATAPAIGAVMAEVVRKALR